MLKNIGLMFAVFAVLFLLAEGVMRLRDRTPYRQVDPAEVNISVKPVNKFYQTDPVLGYRHLPGRHTVTLNGNYEFVATHDEQTFRATSTDSSAAVRPEIWMVGCSFTHGWSINDDETFSWKVQSALSNYRVVNRGVNGYGTIQFYLMLKEALKAGERPDLVVVHHNDAHFERNSFSFKRRRGVSRWNFLGELNQPYGRVDEAGSVKVHRDTSIYDPWPGSTISAAIFGVQRRVEGFKDHQRGDEDIRVTDALLGEIAALSKETGVPLVFSNIWGDTGFLAESSENWGVPYVDIAVDLSIPGMDNMPHDGHPGPRANEIFATKLTDFLIEAGLVTKDY